VGTFSVWHWLVVLVVVVLLFGAGKIPRLMGDMAQGIKAFRAGMKEDETAPAKVRNDGPGA
jgi:sec-independent protein translocase protein TatA